MIEWVTVLTLIAGALVVLVVLHLVARSVNRSRAKAAAKSKAPNATAGQPHLVAGTIGDQGLTAGSGSVPKASTPGAASTGRQSAATDSTAIPNKSPGIAALPRRVARAKPIGPTKLARRPKRRANGAHAQASTFHPLSKAKPAIVRRPKRIAQVRRRKSSSSRAGCKNQDPNASASAINRNECARYLRAVPNPARIASQARPAKSAADTSRVINAVTTAPSITRPSACAT
jgi:hypothetical protein